MNLKKTALVCGVALSLLSLSSFNTVASASNKHHVTYSKLSKKNNKNVKSLNKKLRALKKTIQAC
ncbi:hypothetical protein [Apilactobacillus ozensis]|uniref:hypothetical protein n=1 Tax=Apilactobacillus ozensis TaxID=866801 RepID=UPI0006D06D2E|nr:hypothetical protein [Apilactobacillus ozensis]